MRRILMTLAVFCLWLCGFSGCSREPRPLGDIVLITVDTLRADHMELYGYSRQTTPQLSQLFRNGAGRPRAARSRSASLWLER